MLIVKAPEKIHQSSVRSGTEFQGRGARPARTGVNLYLMILR